MSAKEQIVTPIGVANEYRSIAKNKTRTIDSSPSVAHHNNYGSGGGGNDMESRVAKLESDVSYIRRDIEELKGDVKSIDARLSNIELGISSMKTTVKASCVVASVIFGFCTWIFGSYVAKILDAINALVLK